MKMNIPRVPVVGNTYPVKDQLRAMGGTWNAEMKAWMVPADKAQEAGDLVAAAGPKCSSYRSAQTKSCWECGCPFTYAQCKANDGDWSESYCGC